MPRIEPMHCSLRKQSDNRWFPVRWEMETSGKLERQCSWNGQAAGASRALFFFSPLMSFCKSLGNTSFPQVVRVATWFTWNLHYLWDMLAPAKLPLDCGDPYQVNTRPWGFAEIVTSLSDTFLFKQIWIFYAFYSLSVTKIFLFSRDPYHPSF